MITQVKPIEEAIGRLLRDVGSLHVVVPPQLAEDAVSTGWAEIHPVARRGLIPMNIVMLYAPRNNTELEVVIDLLRAAHRFALGELLPPD